MNNDRIRFIIVGAGKRSDYLSALLLKQLDKDI